LGDRREGYLDPVIQQLEGLKLLKDWSIWMVTVETAAITFLGAAAGRVIDSETIFFPVAIVLFTASIVFAAWVLGGIPSVAQRLDGSGNLFHYKIYRIGWLADRIKLNALTAIQHTLFIFGIICLAVLIIWYRV
jgi:hypothetical protein